MSFEWDTVPAVTFGQLGDEYAAAIHRGVFAIARRRAPEIEAWMKSNAKWTDRSGNARQTLWSEALDFIDTVVNAFGHGVDYGTFLELANGGKYQILGHALDFFTPKIWADVQAMLRR